MAILIESLVAKSEINARGNDVCKDILTVIEYSGMSHLDTLTYAIQCFASDVIITAHPEFKNQIQMIQTAQASLQKWFPYAC